MSNNEMSRPPEKYADRPNLWRVAYELSKSKEPDAVLAILRTRVKETDAA